MKFKTVLLMDFETRWSQGDYTLSKMTTEEYIRDPRFKAYGVCYKRAGTSDAPEWVSHADLPRFFASIDWSTTAVMAHNAMFDASILSWIYGHKPAFIIDTLSMARALRGADGGNSLAKLAEDFGLPPKGRAVHSTSGLDELTPEIEAELAAYCAHDVVLLEGVFNALQGLAGPMGFPVKELHIIDMVMRMYVDPQIELDEKMLLDALAEEHSVRSALLARLKVTDADLASDARFAEILRTLGVEPPTKISKTTGKESFAFAKNDAMFQALLQHDSDEVVLLCEARVRVKSTQARTRAQRFADIAARGALPVPLYYSAAHTHRIQAAKGQGLNMQNLKRGSFLRRALMAPFGYTFVVVDLSQIEPRVLAWLTGYDRLLDIFRSGKDAYALFGAQMFGIPGLSKETHPDLRQAAKSAMLGCGFGMGWAAFAAQLLTGFMGAPPMRYGKAFAKQLGVTARHVQRFVEYAPNVERLMEIPHTCTTEQLLIHAVCAQEIINRYRDASAPVKKFWDTCSSLIASSLHGGQEHDLKCVHFEQGRIVLPSGLTLRYPNLGAALDARGRQQWSYGQPEDYSGAKVKRERLYGGKLCVDGDASVLTDSGWKRLADVTLQDRVHDGVEFVAHGGLLFKSVQQCVTVDGVRMTPDHEVLTDEGWRPASSNPRPYRPDLRHADGATPRPVGREEARLGLRMRVRRGSCQGGDGREERGAARGLAQLRVHDEAATAHQANDARTIEASAVRSVALNGGPLQAAVASGVAQLRRARHHCVRALAGVSELLGRRVAVVYAGADAGAQERRSWVQPGQLHVGHVQAAGNEQALLARCRHTDAGRRDGHTEVDAVLPTEARAVFDLMDCGPRKRFVVRGASGPFIVHNCENIVQAVARCVMTDGMLRIQKRYPCVLTVHDETVILVPTTEVAEAEPWVLEQMTKVPAYMPGIPLAAETGTGVRYGDAKG